ncbi:MAG: redoxin domain-containing protein [Armatimonadota bacterium]
MRRAGALLLVVLIAVMLSAGCGRRTVTKLQIKSPVASASGDRSGKVTGNKENAVSNSNPVENTKPGMKPVKPLKNPTAKDVLLRTAEVYKSINTLKLKGTIYAELSAEGKSKNSQGQVEMSFSRPNKIMLRTSGQGNEGLIVSDGKAMYIYAHSPGMEKMRGGYSKIYRKASAPKSVSELNSGREGGITTPGLLSGMNLTPYIKSARLKPSEKVGGVDTYVITYPVKTGRKGMTRTETLWIGKNDFLLRQIKTLAQISPSAMGPAPKGVKGPKGSLVISQKTIMSLVQAGQTIPSGTFKFVPPPGAKNAATIKPPKMPNPPAPPKVTGKKAPGFSIPSLNGKEISLSSYRGRNVLLVFWALGSPQSKKALPEIQKLNKMLGNGGTAILSINLDGNNEATGKFIKENGISFPVMVGSEKTFKTALNYGLRNLPTIFIIGKDGTVKGEMIGIKSANELKTEVAKHGIH